MTSEGIVQDESFVERRALYRGIWDAATTEVSVDKQALKPKVIKTLNLDRLSNSAGQLKKQRIKNLRSVCKKILDFCDRHEKEELPKTQVTTEIQKSSADSPNKQETTTAKNKHNKTASKEVNKFGLKDNSRSPKAENITGVFRKTNDHLTELNLATKVTENPKTSNKLSKRHQGDGIKKQKTSVGSSAANSMGPRKVLKRKSPVLLKKFSYTGRRRIRHNKKKLGAKDATASKLKIASGSTSFGVSSKISPQKF